MKKVAVVDYGVGNLFSIECAFRYCGIEVEFVSTPNQILEANYLLLPGVGAFKDGMQELRNRNLIPAIMSYCSAGKPFMGICLGMQMLFEEGEEFGTHLGLGLISGRVVRIPETKEDGNKHKIPHIGWSPLHPVKEEIGEKEHILHDIGQSSSMYFVHSYHAQPTEPECIIAYADYNGRKITALVRSKNIYGCQFHPEKSGESGLKILKNFMS